MGTNTNQIATEANTESSYGTYISSTTTNKKCITVKRLLKGLLETSNTPSYVASDFSSGFTNKYDIKTWGYCSATSVSLSKYTGVSAFGNKTSQIIETTANNYGAYPFSTGTAFLAISSVRTITATITVTYAEKVIYNPASDDGGVSTASMDFDNPEEDTESNTSGQEPNVAGNARLTVNGCTNQGNGIVNNDCTCFGNNLAVDGTPGGGSTCLRLNICDPIGTTPTEPITRTFSLNISLQIYNGVDSAGNDNYIDILTSNPISYTVTLNTGISTIITLSIPTRTVFAIDGTPTGAFKFKLNGTFGVGFDNTTDYSGDLSATITATMPQVNFVVYNPGPKCIKYSDLPTVYKLYGKTV
jgi:hypothetical protein